MYLAYGLAVILGFIGAKLVIHALHTNELPFINGGEHVTAIPEIPTWLSLAVILATLVVTTVASLAKSRRDSADRARARRRRGRASAAASTSDDTCRTSSRPLARSHRPTALRGRPAGRGARPP